MDELFLVLPKVVVIEFTVLRQGFPKCLLKASFTDTGKYRSYNITGHWHDKELDDFISVLQRDKREYRLLSLEDPTPEGN